MVLENQVVRKLTYNSEYRFRGSSLPILIKFISQVDGVVFREPDSIHTGGGDFSLPYQIHTGSVPQASPQHAGYREISPRLQYVLRGPKYSYSLVNP